MFGLNRAEVIGRLGADVTVNHLVSGGRVIERPRYGRINCNPPLPSAASANPRALRRLCRQNAATACRNVAS